MFKLVLILHHHVCPGWNGPNPDELCSTGLSVAKRDRHVEEDGQRFALAERIRVKVDLGLNLLDVQIHCNKDVMNPAHHGKVFQMPLEKPIG